MWKTLLPAAAIVFGLSSVAPSPVLASDAFVFGKSDSRIEFVIHHHGWSVMKGSFQDFDGQLRVDPTDPESALVEVNIRTASIDAGHSYVEGHLRSRDFFNVERYPTMTFKSTRIVLTGDHTGQLEGDLTLLGVTHPLVLDVTLQDIKNRSGRRAAVAVFTAKGTMSRTAFGMEWGPDGFAEDVDIRIEIAAQRL